MKKYIIRGAEKVEVAPHVESMRKSVLADGDDNMIVTDGYHTMDELYAHRIALFIALCKDLDGNNHPRVWRSKKHSDGSAFEGWFIMGINTEPGEQITYHLPMSEWENTNFAKERDTAPLFDGHTPADVLNRLKNI